MKPFHRERGLRFLAGDARPRAPADVLFPDLAESQQDAVRFAMAQEVGSLWGPSGTGKTEAVAHHYRDNQLEEVAANGHGNYACIDRGAEGQKIFSEQVAGTLWTVARDVKVQIEFNPETVRSWRQIGYENRQMAAAAFRDDAQDACELGAGHTVTALYEITPASAAGVEDRAARGHAGEEGVVERRHVDADRTLEETGGVGVVEVHQRLGRDGSTHF